MKRVSRSAGSARSRRVAAGGLAAGGRPRPPVSGGARRRHRRRRGGDWPNGSSPARPLAGRRSTCRARKPAACWRPWGGRGVSVGSWHPLQTFAAPDPSLWKGIPVVLEGDPGAVAAGRDLAARLGAEPVELPADSRPLYHCLSTISCAHVAAQLLLCHRALPAFPEPARRSCGKAGAAWPSAPWPNSMPQRPGAPSRDPRPGATGRRWSSTARPWPGACPGGWRSIRRSMNSWSRLPKPGRRAIRRIDFLKTIFKSWTRCYNVHISVLASLSVNRYFRCRRWKSKPRDRRRHGFFLGLSDG